MLKLPAVMVSLVVMQLDDSDMHLLSIRPSLDF